MGVVLYYLGRDDKKKNSVPVLSRLNSFWIFYIYDWLYPWAQSSHKEG